MSLEETAEDLLRLDSFDSLTASLFLDLSSRDNKKALETSLNSLLKDFSEKAANFVSDNPDAKEEVDWLESALSRAGEQALESKDCRAVAVFCDRKDDFVKIIPLQQRLESRTVLSRRPEITPLFEELNQTSGWGVLLITRDQARYFSGGQAKLVEQWQLSSSVRGQHSRGDLNSASNVRKIKEEVRQHLRETRDKLEAEPEPDRHTILSVNAELEGDAKKELGFEPAAVIRLDEANVSTDQLEEACAGPIEKARQQESENLVQSIAARLGQADNLVAVGLEESLEMLNQKRVETLIIAEGYTDSAYYDPDTQLMSVRPEGLQCPVRRQDILLEARLQAWLSGTEVAIVEAELLEEKAPIVALLRY
jgi:peptide chain release factor subunit 1